MKTRQWKHTWLFCLLLISLSLLSISCSSEGNDDDDDFATSSESSEDFASSGTAIAENQSGSASFAKASGLANRQEQESTHFYLSYDDSASTASVELVKHWLNSNQKSRISSDLGRPWEFLNFETFTQDTQSNHGLFDISIELQKTTVADSHLNTLFQRTSAISSQEDLYELGVHISAPTLSNQDRQAAVLTLLIDISGSMNTPMSFSDSGEISLLEALKEGLTTLYGSLKNGDEINIVLFGSNASVLSEGFVVTKDSTVPLQAGNSDNNLDAFQALVDEIHSAGSTNLNAGVDLAYEVAQRRYQASRVNRVIIMTDAFANTGEVNPEKISQKTQINDAEGIYFSGLGFGEDFNEAFLNELTEAGRGAYFSIASTTDLDRALGERFQSLINVAAKNVRFRIDHPVDLKHVMSAAEEVSSNAADVQPTNFSYNTSQYFYEVFASTGSDILEQPLKFTIQYQDPISDEATEVVLENPLQELMVQSSINIVQARLVSSLAFLIDGAIKCSDIPNDLRDQITFSNTTITEYLGFIETYCERNLSSDNNEN